MMDSDEKSIVLMIETSLLSDIGCCRKDNEDYLQLFSFGNETSTGGKEVLAILADGMGGHQGGEVASRMAVEVIGQTYFRQPGSDPVMALKTSFAKANQAIYETAVGDPTLRGMGTTCTALVLRNGQACFAHVGDSRLYRLRDGGLVLLTVDHTLVNGLIAGGFITPAEARKHPDRSIVTRSVGTQPEISVDTSEGLLPIQPGDVYLLCSDGLHDLVEDEEIRLALLCSPPHAASEQLIALARQRGGYDNISVGVLAVREPASTPKRAAITRETAVKPTPDPVNN
jgi:protein phosphatase